MPCFGPDGPPDHLLPDGGRMRREYYGMMMREDLDSATQAACEMAKYFRRNGGFDALSKSTRKWIVEHEKLDKKRRKK